MRSSGTGLGRSVALFKAFRVEQSDPDHFYRFQANDSLNQVAGHMDVAGKLVLDVGGGAGYFSEAFRAAGANCFLVEPEAGRQPGVEGGADQGQLSPDEEAATQSLGSLGRAGPDPTPEMTLQRQRHSRAVAPARLVPHHAVAGDGNRLPFPDKVADLTFSSNVLEHVADPARFLDESIRVTRPGGLIYLSFTAWYSPWGGHETSPWHYLGGERAAHRYHRRHGRPPGNLFGKSMFATHIGPTLRLAESHRQVEVLQASPRYYPSWLNWLIRVPLVREVAAWNLLLVMRRRPLAASDGKLG